MHAQQYVRYTKNETIAAAAAAAAAAPLLPLPLRSSAAGPCRARYANAGLYEDPNRLVVVKKQGCDWGACGRPRRRDLATSLALRDGRGEGGPARRQGPRDRGLSLGASLATKRGLAAEKSPENGSRALSAQGCFTLPAERSSMKVYMFTRALRGGPLWRPAASLVGCMRCQVL